MVPLLMLSLLMSALLMFQMSVVSYVDVAGGGAFDAGFISLYLCMTLRSRNILSITSRTWGSTSPSKNTGSGPWAEQAA